MLAPSAPATHISHLPTEVLLHIYHYLDDNTCFACAAVCRCWQKVAGHPSTPYGKQQLFKQAALGELHFVWGWQSPWRLFPHKWRHLHSVESNLKISSLSNAIITVDLIHAESKRCFQTELLCRNSQTLHKLWPKNAIFLNSNGNTHFFLSPQPVGCRLKAINWQEPTKNRCLILPYSSTTIIQSFALDETTLVTLTEGGLIFWEIKKDGLKFDEVLALGVNEDKAHAHRLGHFLLADDTITNLCTRTNNPHNQKFYFSRDHIAISGLSFCIFHKQAQWEGENGTFTYFTINDEGQVELKWQHSASELVELDHYYLEQNPFQDMNEQYLCLVANSKGVTNEAKTITLSTQGVVIDSYSHHFYNEPCSRLYGDILITSGRWSNESTISINFRHMAQHRCLERVDLSKFIPEGSLLHDFHFEAEKLTILLTDKHYYLYEQHPQQKWCIIELNTHMPLGKLSLASCKQHKSCLIQ